VVGTPEVERQEPTSAAHRVEAHVSLRQRIRVLSSSGVELAVIYAAPKKAFLFLHQHNIRGPRTFGRLNYILLKHVGNVLLNSVQVRG